MIHALIWSAMHSPNWRQIRFNFPICIQIHTTRYSRQWEINIAIFSRPAIVIPGYNWLEYERANPGSLTEIPF